MQKNKNKITRYYTYRLSAPILQRKRTFSHKTRQSTDEVIADIEQKVAERKEALETVENDLLIRDRFDLSEEDEEILDVIDRSLHGDVGEDDIEILVREFFDEFWGDIRGIRPGPARSEGDIFQLEVPNMLSGGQVSNQ